MKKLLIAGGSHADIPVIKAAKQMGYYVITGGNNPNDYGHTYSDMYVPFDYSDKQAVLKVAKAQHIDAICSSANDFSALSSSYAAQVLDLPGHDSYQTAETIHHKDKFREYAQTLGLSVPKAYRLKQNESYKQSITNLHFPLIVKPTDLSGGKGVTKINDLQQLQGAIDHAFEMTRQNTIVIEEFIKGSNHGYSTFIQDGKVIFSFMDDEHYFVNPFLVSGASTSLKYSKNITDKLDQNLEKLAASLNLVDGLLHVQFILKGDIPYIIEICRRTPGDFYVKLVEYATDYPMSNAIIKAVTGNTLPKSPQNNPVKYITRHCVMSQKTGKIDFVDHGMFKSMIFDRFVMYKTGDAIQDIQTYKAEIDFIAYQDKEEMAQLQKCLTKEIQIRFAS